MFKLVYLKVIVKNREKMNKQHGVLNTTGSYSAQCWCSMLFQHEGAPPVGAFGYCAQLGLRSLFLFSGSFLLSLPALVQPSLGSWRRSSPELDLNRNDNNTREVCARASLHTRAIRLARAFDLNTKTPRDT